MPRKTVPRRLPVAGDGRRFNEAAARCRGKPVTADRRRSAVRSLQ